MIERALILDPAHGLDNLDLLPAPARRGPARRMPLRASATSTCASRSNRLERELLLEAQRRAGHVRKEAARLLGIDPRNLAYYLRKHGMANEGEDG